jgi:Zn-dependent peptidase ImmA (M78 family)
MLRRGFKSEADWYSREFRRELGVALYGPLCPWRLSQHLEIPVMAIAAYAEDHPQEVAYLRSKAGQKEFSAVTLCKGFRRLVIFNDGHSKKRQAADIVHELSHCILHHPAKPPFDESGSRHYDAELEEEANWLGPALLVSEEAALDIVRRGYDVGRASDVFGVSEDVIRMRLNVTAAYRRVRSSAA